MASDGGIFSFGDAPFFGSTGDIKLNRPIAGIAATRTGQGYWMVAVDGGIFSFGDAAFHGSTGAMKLNQPIVGMAPTPSGAGYWLVASDGGIFAFGDAAFFGSTGDIKLNRPIVGMAATPSGNGYWFVASDGGIFSFGDAAFFGSVGGNRLTTTIAGMAATPSGRGYWLTASDGGVFPFGDATYFGAAASRPAAGGRAVAALVPAGAGYWQASSTGEVLAFGAAADFGGLPRPPGHPIVGMAAVPGEAVAVASGESVDTGLPSGGGTATTTPTATTTTTRITPAITTTTTTTTTATTTTSTTRPPSGVPTAFSSTAKVSWGTPTDLNESTVNSSGETVYPYSQKVSAIVEIGDRVYIGGEFTDLVKVDRTPSGVPMKYLAELDANGFPVPGSAFNATVRLDGPVRALHRSPDGRRLYVGGEFKNVNGQRRDRLVALDPATGEIDRTFNPPVPNRYVSSIAVHGSQVYIGGAFEQMGSTPRGGVAALNNDGTLNVQFVPPPRY
ncbi:MAG: hypothetical protein ACRDYV_10835, partial [Acidimicrobiia bacterium]